MNPQQKEINHDWHIHGKPIHEIAKAQDMSQEQVCVLIVTWNEFFKELTK